MSRRKFSGIGAVIPVLQVTFHPALHDGHHIEPLAPAHRVLNDVKLRAQPGRDLLAAQILRQAGLAAPWRDRPNARAPAARRR